MDAETYKERIKRLKEVNEMVQGLDPAIRASAFTLLEEYVTGEKVVSPSATAVSEPQEEIATALEKFATAIGHEKPSDNVFALAAFYYSQYGSALFSVDEIRSMATDVGVTVPARVDVTFKSAQRGGKSLFKRMGKGKYQPTVHGEAFFKNTYDVVKGRRRKSVEPDSD